MNRTKEETVELIEKCLEESGGKDLFYKHYTESTVDGIVINSLGEGRVNSEYEVVLEIEGQYWKFFGYYDSWNGTDFDGWQSNITEVFKKEITVTVYE